MKNHTQIMLTLLFSMAISFNVQSQFSFEIVIEGEGESHCGVSGLIETSTGYFIGKYSRQQYTDTLDTWNEYLIKISPDGDTSTFLFHKEDTILFFTREFQVSENPVQYLVSGMNYPIGLPDWKNEFFMLLDENFEIIWEKQYKLSAIASGFASRDIMQLADGSFLYARQPDYIQDYMYLFHLSTNGDSLNFRSYEDDSAGQVMALTYSPDSSEFWLHTRLAHFEPIGPESQVIVLNEELEQTKVIYYPRGYSENYYAKNLPDNKLLSGGRFFDFESSHLATYIVDTGLNVLIEDYLTHPDTTLAATGKCVDYYYDNQIFVGGTHNNSLWGEHPSWYVIAKYNSELELIYECYIGDSANYWLFNLTATSDSGVILSGTRYDYWEPVTKKKAIIIKLNPDGIIVGDREETIEIKIKKAIVYPNPGSNTLLLRTALRNATFVLYDLQGRLILMQKVEQLISHFSTENLASGVYTWTLSDGKHLLESGKWVKQEK